MTNDPAPCPLRRSVEQFSRPMLLRLRTIPRWLIPLFTVGLLAVGVLAPVPVGMVALALVLVCMLWLYYLSWPAVTTGGRLMRIAVVVMLVVIAVVRLQSAA